MSKQGPVCPQEILSFVNFYCWLWIRHLQQWTLDFKINQERMATATPFSLGSIASFFCSRPPLGCLLFSLTPNVATTLSALREPLELRWLSYAVQALLSITSLTALLLWQSSSLIDYRARGPHLGLHSIVAPWINIYSSPIRRRTGYWLALMALTTTGSYIRPWGKSTALGARTSGFHYVRMYFYH